MGKRLTYIFIICLFFAGCRQPSEIDRHLVDAEMLIEVSPDSALSIIDKIVDAESANISDEQEAKISVIAAKAKLRKGKSFLTDENFDRSISYFESVRDTVSLIDMYQLASIKMRWMNEQDSAAMFIKKAIGIASQSSQPSKSDLYIELSNLYARPSFQKDYQNAVIYARKALECAISPEEKARALHDIGLFYSFCNQNDSAIAYIGRALAEIEPDDPYYTSYALNYANTPSADFAQSVDYLMRIKNESLGKLITLGFIYLNNSQPDSARRYVREAGTLYYANPSKYSINTYNNLRLLERSVDLHDTGVVLPYMGTVTNDSISEIMTNQRKISEERRDYNNRLQLRLLEAKARRQLGWNIALSLSLLLAIGLGIAILYGKRRYMRLKRQLDNMKVEQIVSEANDDIGEPTTIRGLTEQRLHICIEQFRISKLQGDIDKMDMYYRSSGNYPSLKNRETVQNGLIACFADFIVDLKMTGVKLSVDDIVTCIMSCLNESNTAIASCLGTTDTAVRTRKTRLRAKLPAYIIKMLDL